MPPARRVTRGQVIEALELILQVLREGMDPEALPLVPPSSSRPGRPCPVHLKELVQGPRGYRCPVQGCREVAA